MFSSAAGLQEWHLLVCVVWLPGIGGCWCQGSITEAAAALLTWIPELLSRLGVLTVRLYRQIAGLAGLWRSCASWVEEVVTNTHVCGRGGVLTGRKQPPGISHQRSSLGCAPLAFLATARGAGPALQFRKAKERWFGSRFGFRSWFFSFLFFLTFLVSVQSHLKRRRICWAGFAFVSLRSNKAVFEPKLELRVFLVFARGN